VVAHETVGIEGEIGATGQTVIVVLDTHAIEGVDELVIVLCIAEDLLMVLASLW
jgi:hypothetical protein